jgi:hypothetical protein
LPKELALPWPKGSVVLLLDIVSGLLSNSNLALREDAFREKDVALAPSHAQETGGPSTTDQLETVPPEICPLLSSSAVAAFARRAVGCKCALVFVYMRLDG